MPPGGQTMPLFILSALIQICCVVHIIRTGRNQMWLLAVVFLPIAGSAAYFLLEVAPGLASGRQAQAVRDSAVRVIEPERELRSALDALKLVETPANHVRAGDALVALDRGKEGIGHFEAALSGVNVDDRSTKFRLATVLLGAGNAARALELADGLPQGGSSESDRNVLLRAKCLEALDRPAEAMMLYADIVTRVPGEEVRCRYAALLLAANRKAEARVLLTEVRDRARRLTRRQRAVDARMYEWAAGELAKLG